MVQGKLTSVVQTAGLCKTFRDFWRRPRVEAVKDLTLQIQPGEVFGLLGPNGSGKSTTIKMLLGLLYPTKGRIAVFGKTPTDVGVKSRIGFLPEESYLYRFLNARETLDYFGRLFRLPPQVRSRRTEMLLEMVGLKHEAARRIGEYSKGMARRIGLAQALINDPEFLILDEPTSGMDPIGTRQIKDVIRELGQRGKTILLSSHLLADVEDVCDRVTILYGGRQRAAGHIDELLSENDLTQITTEHLKPETVEQIRDVVQRLEAKDILNVTTPRVRLEDYFLKIVEEARRENVATSGVSGAGELAEFLSESAEPTTEAVVDTLVRAADVPEGPEAIAVEPTPLPERREPEQEVLDQLLGSADRESGQADQPGLSKTEGSPTSSDSAQSGEASTGAPSAPVEAPSPSPVDADRSIIDDLLTREVPANEVSKDKDESAS